MLIHIDLFSGIGGFALAARWAGFRTEVFCEIDSFCQEVLKARFRAIADSESMGRRNGTTENERTSAGKIDTPSDATPILIPDIRDFDGTRWRGATLLTGGFPCQPFSCAGKRRGKADDRFLWPEMLRVISEARPAWVLGENVAGIVNMELEQVCLDLEAEGYEVQPIIIPACAVNAPHRRDRVWIIANSGDNSDRSITGQISETDGIQKINREALGSRLPTRTDSDAPDTEGRGREQGNQDSRGTQERKGTPRPGDRSSYGGWGEAWPEVATRLCRVDDGVPRRVDRLKALGNAIVPQVAYEIIKEIARIEEATA